MAFTNNYSRYVMAFVTIAVSATLFWFGNGFESHLATDVDCAAAGVDVCLEELLARNRG